MDTDYCIGILHTYKNVVVPKVQKPPSADLRFNKFSVK